MGGGGHLPTAPPHLFLRGDPITYHVHGGPPRERGRSPQLARLRLDRGCVYGSGLRFEYQQRKKNGGSRGTTNFRRQYRVFAVELNPSTTFAKKKPPRRNSVEILRGRVLSEFSVEEFRGNSPRKSSLHPKNPTQGGKRWFTLKRWSIRSGKKVARREQLFEQCSRTVRVTCVHDCSLGF